MAVAQSLPIAIPMKSRPRPVAAADEKAEELLDDEGEVSAAEIGQRIEAIARTFHVGPHGELASPTNGKKKGGFKWRAKS